VLQKKDVPIPVILCFFFLVFGSRRHVRRAKSQSGSGNTPLALAEGWSPPSMLSRSEVTDVMAIFFGDQKIGKDT